MRTARRQRALRPRAWLLAWLALTLGALEACSRGASDPQSAAQMGQAAPLPVTAIVVQPQDLPITWEVMGQTQGSREVEVRPRVTGILLERRYTEGSFVKRGALLFRIDPLPFETALEQARGLVGQAEAELARTERDVARLRPLYADNAVSRKELDDAIAAMQSAQASLFSARARLKAAQIDLGYTTIGAPISGVTSRAAVSEGSLVNAYETLLTRIFQVDPLWVTFNFAAKEYAQFRNEVSAGRIKLPTERELVVELERQTGEVYERKGRVNFRDATVDPKTGTILGRAQFPNPEAEILPGAFVRLRIHGAVRPDAILIPQRAMLHGGGGQAVYVLTDAGKADLRPIVTGETRGENIIVVEGLKAGEQVIVEGIVKLRPGAPVELVAGPKTDAAASPAGAAPGARDARR